MTVPPARPGVIVRVPEQPNIPSLSCTGSNFAPSTSSGHQPPTILPQPAPPSSAASGSSSTPGVSSHGTSSSGNSASQQIVFPNSSTSTLPSPASSHAVHVLPPPSQAGPSNMAG